MLLVAAAVLVAIGLAGAAATSRVLSTLLCGVGASDPATFVAIPLLLLALAAVACYLPGRRVYRIDPVDAIRAA